MIRRLRRWWASLSVDAPRQDFTDSRLNESDTVGLLKAQIEFLTTQLESRTLQLETALTTQKDLIARIGEITAFLAETRAQRDREEAAIRTREAEITAQISALQAENQRLKEQAAAGVSGLAELEAAVLGMTEAAKKLGAPSEAAA